MAGRTIPQGPGAEALPPPGDARRDTLKQRTDDLQKQADELAAEMRRHARSRVPDFDERRALLHAFIESDALDLIRAGRREEAAGIAETLLDQAGVQGTRVGKGGS